MDRQLRAGAVFAWVCVIVAAAAFASSGGAEASREADASSRACTKFASPQGSNRSRGTRRRPFRTAQRLARSLRAGQTGCLRQGVYTGKVGLRRRGRAGAPIVLRSMPGESAKLVGRVVVGRRAEHVTVRGLYLDGRNAALLPSPTVAGRDIRFIGNDVTNGHTGICFALGHPRYGTAEDVVIRSNRIHNCGRLPATNHDHGVYVAKARRTRLTGNWIYANADRGIQLYPDAQQTYIAGNVIDGNGEGVIFGGDLTTASSENLLEGNVITGSTVRHNVESYYPPGGPIGYGNVVRRNCLAGGVRAAAGGGGISPPIGFISLDNLLASPRFRSRARRDYRLVGRGQCANAFAGDPGARPGPRLRAPRGFRLGG